MLVWVSIVIHTRLFQVKMKLGASTVAYWIKLPPVMLLSHMGAGSIPRCSTSLPVPCWCPRKSSRRRPGSLGSGPTRERRRCSWLLASAWTSPNIVTTQGVNKQIKIFVFLSVIKKIKFLEGLFIFIWEADWQGEGIEMFSICFTLQMVALHRPHKISLFKKIN